MNMQNEMRGSFNSEYTQSATISGQHRRQNRNSLRELEEENLPLVDHPNAFNSSSLEINVESSSGSSSSSNSASMSSRPKNKIDLIQV